MGTGGYGRGSMECTQVAISGEQGRRVTDLPVYRLTTISIKEGAIRRLT